MRIYVDTNVYLDYLLNRKNRKGKDLSKSAFSVFKRTLSCEFEIVISALIFKELNRNISAEKISMLMSFLDKKLINIYEEKEDIEKAQHYKHKTDARHAILAEKGNAEIIVTRNKIHFNKFSIKSKLPENL